MNLAVRDIRHNAGRFVFTTVGIVYVLVSESLAFFSHVPLWSFLTDTQWTPLFDDAHFGIMVLLSGTVTSSLVALSVASTLLPPAFCDSSTPMSRSG